MDIPKFKLIFTAAVEAEIPSQWLKSLGVPVYSLKALESGALNLIEKSSQKTKGILVVITGVGLKNSSRAAEWICEHLDPLFVVNIGTCGCLSRTLPFLTWITPKSVFFRCLMSDVRRLMSENQFGLNIDTRLPFPDLGILRVIVPALMSVEKSSVLEPQNLPQDDVIDMESYFQARVFAKHAIRFHVLKLISDYSDQSYQQDYFQNLEKIRMEIQRVLGWVETSFCTDDTTVAPVSVVIPVYNRKSCIRDCIESVLNQTLVPAEIIVVDDGSDDGTYEILQAYEHADQITLIRLSQNQGVSHARNIGVARAKSDWIALLDSDDIWLPQKLLILGRFIRMYPFFEILQSEEIWVRNGKRVNPCKHHQKREGFIFVPSLELCLISPSGVIFKKDLFHEFGEFDEALPVCEDYDLWLKMTRTKVVGLESVPLITKYGGHADQLSKIYPMMDHYRIMSLYTMYQKETDAYFKKAIGEVLNKKLGILILGCLKRGKVEEAEGYKNMLRDA